jgi:hypothetical protein
MTPTEKAKELATKMYYTHGNINSSTAKKCALIAVDEILLSNPTWFIDQMKSTNKYWEDVRAALNAL